MALTKPDILYTKDDVMDALKYSYFSYIVTHRQEQYGYYGGQPEEGLYYCDTCGIEWGDEHEDDCYDKASFEAVEAFIDRGLR